MSAEPTPLVRELEALATRGPCRIAQRIGIHPAALTHIVKGRRHPDVRTLGKILTAYPTLELEILAELRLRAQEDVRATS